MTMMEILGEDSKGKTGDSKQLLSSAPFVEH